MCVYYVCVCAHMLPSPSLLDSGPVPNSNWFSFRQKQKTSNDSQSERVCERASKRVKKQRERVRARGTKSETDRGNNRGKGLYRFHISVSAEGRVRNDWRLEMESVREREK